MVDFANKPIARRTLARVAMLGAISTGVALCAHDAQRDHGDARDQADASQAAEPHPSRLAIIHTTDAHGHVLFTDESLGLSAVAQLKSDWEAKGYEVLLLDAGDATQGSDLVNLSRGKTAIALMSHVGYDAMALGDHEFAFGQKSLEACVESAAFALLSANVIHDDTGNTLVDDNAVFTLKDGRKVGVFGLTAPEATVREAPFMVGGLTFYAADDLYACAQRQVNELRSRGCELVVCLGHLGQSDVDKPNRAQDVIRNISGLDLLIDGHDHVEESRAYKDADGNRVLVVNSSCHMQAIGVVTWEDDILASRMVHVGDYEGQDAEVAAFVADKSDESQAELAAVIATSPVLLNGDASPGVRTHETNLGDLVADALLWKAQQSLADGADVAVVLGGCIQQSLQAGDVTRGDLLDALPSLAHACTIRLSGKQLLESLEVACHKAPREFEGFPQVAGIKFVADASVAYKRGEQYLDSTLFAPKDPGSRVTIASVGEKPFDESATYTVTTADAMCADTSAAPVFAIAARRSIDVTDCLVSSAVQDYLADVCHGEVSTAYAEPQGRILIATT